MRRSLASSNVHLSVIFNHAILPRFIKHQAWPDTYALSTTLYLLCQYHFFGTVYRFHNPYGEICPTQLITAKTLERPFSL